MKKTILPYILKNAYDFNGSVNEKAVLGLVLRAHPELKKDVPVVLKEINNLASEVSKLTPKEIKKQLQTISPKLLQKEKEEVKGPLKPLPNAVKGKFVVRIAPSPSGALHIGHAYGAALNAGYAAMYDGEFILRIEDTNPENIYPDAYRLIQEDAQWLTNNKVSQVVIQSDRLGIYYDYAEKLVDQGDAYVCTCDADQGRELKNQSQVCPCRDLSKKEQLKRYAKMFSGYAEGEAVLRVKTDINHKNPAMRDFSIMRINEHVHPRTGKEQRVWPLMVFSVAIDDHELGITHVLNGKDHADNGKKEAMIMEMLHWKPPEYKHWGRINFDGFQLSTSKTRLKIEQGEYTGWDDIRLPFLPALRRRGYQPEAFKKFAAAIGLSLNDKTVSQEEFWKMINSFNGECIEADAKRYFAVIDPLGIKIKKAPSGIVEVPLHPNHPEKGKRKLPVKEEIYITEEDYNQLAQNKVHRLIDYCNFTAEKGKLSFHSKDYDSYRSSKDKGKIIHWLPVEETVNVEIKHPDGKTMIGKGEKILKKLPAGTIVQLERMFYARIDSVDKEKVILWYLHE